MEFDRPIEAGFGFGSFQRLEVPVGTVLIYQMASEK